MFERCAAVLLWVALATSATSHASQGAEPPMPAEIRRFFADADVVAAGRVSALRITSPGGVCCHVSYRFTPARFLKGDDVARFEWSFEPRGATEAMLRGYYTGDIVFFYRKSVMAGAVTRDSIWVASSAFNVDCAIASNAVERAICEDPKLAAADRAMAAAYRSLTAKLTGAAKDHLVKDQARWIDSRNRDCGATIDDPGDCLEARYAWRIKNLKEFGARAYPFVGTQQIYKTGEADKNGRYAIDDIRYPQFDGTTADFTAINRRFVEEARKVMANTTATGSLWSYEQGFSVSRPSSRTVAIAVEYNNIGPRPNGHRTCALVDLRTGQPVGPEGVFQPGDAWLKLMIPMVRARVRTLVEDRESPEGLKPANLTKSLRDPNNYCYRNNRLELILDPYVLELPDDRDEIRVDIPYARLKPLFRATGPLGTR